MTLTQEQKDEFDMQSMGCLRSELEQAVLESLTYQYSDITMCIMSLLSDAQEELAMGLNEKSRQTINKAKYLIMRHNENKM